MFKIKNMLDPLDYENRPIFKKLARKRHFAGLILFLENLTRSLWRPVIWTLFFCALWMFQIPLILGQFVSVITTITFLIGLGYLLYKDSERLRSKASIDRRIEKESGVKHRPLSAIEDKLANPQKPQTRSLWHQSKASLLSALPQLKFIKPQAFMAKTDPYALRFGVLLFFLCGILVAGHGWDSRIRYGVAPFSFNDTATMQRGVSLWITPPEYTNLSQIILEGTDQDNSLIEIPTGSILKLQVSGGLGKPTLYINEQSWPLKHASDDNYILELEVPNHVEEGSSITIKQFLMTRASWPYKRIPDTAPTITLADDIPEVLPEGSMRFPMTLNDDYGVQTLGLTMKLDQEIVGPPLGESFKETRSIISPGGQDFETSPLYDLTSHPWAGLPAVFEFTARDHVGNEAQSQPVQMVLPERIFRHPVAKELIALRKQLIWNPDGPYMDIAGEIEDLMVRPNDYQHDIVVFLSLRSASSRLFYQNQSSTQTAQAIVAQLWDTALRIEDGNLSLASRNLRDAQNALEKAMRSGEASKEEIARLMDDLRQAMSEYFTELQKEMQKRIAEGQQMMTIPPEMLGQVIEPDALANFLDQLEQAMQSGETSSAQEMLSQLQRMMDMMNPSIAGPMPPDMQMMAEGVNELQELIENQEKLLERTNQQIDVWESIQDFQRDYGDMLPRDDKLLEKWGIDKMPPPPSKNDKLAPPTGINTQANKEEQEALRYILGQLMLEADKALGEIPENMGKAEREMLSSSTMFGENHPHLSIPHQELAIKYLKEAQESLSQQFAQRMQQMTGLALGGGQMRYDPLGRPYGEDGGDNPFPGSKIEIPDEAEKKRAHEILRLLRDRSGEFNRPREELEYYRRLLKQF